MGDTKKLTVAGDGSALVSAANPNGKPICNCRKQGIFSCDHDRFYTDSTANWGYDSYRECYYFGHTFYQHVVSTQGHDLPIHVGIGPASETDFTLSLKNLDKFRKALKENGLDWQIRHAVYDAGHDALVLHGVSFPRFVDTRFLPQTRCLIPDFLGLFRGLFLPWCTRNLRVPSRCGDRPSYRIHGLGNMPIRQARQSRSMSKEFHFVRQGCQ